MIYQNQLLYKLCNPKKKVRCRKQILENDFTPNYM